MCTFLHAHMHTLTSQLRHKYMYVCMTVIKCLPQQYSLGMGSYIDNGHWPTQTESLLTNSITVTKHSTSLTYTGLRYKRM